MHPFAGCLCKSTAVHGLRRRPACACVGRLHLECIYYHDMLCAALVLAPTGWVSSPLPLCPRSAAVSCRAPHFSLSETNSESARAQEQAEVARAFQEANAEVLAAAAKAEALAAKLDDPAEAAAAIDTAGSQKVMDLVRTWVARPLRKCKPLPHWLEEAAEVVEGGTVPGLLLVAATFISLTLANLPATSAPWLAFWAQSVGPHIGSHALSLRAWINEGLMAIFFFVVGLEIKQEFRLGSLASVRKAVLPCLAAFGGMVTPMATYLVRRARRPCRRNSHGPRVAGHSTGTHARLPLLLPARPA